MTSCSINIEFTNSVSGISKKIKAKKYAAYKDILSNLHETGFLSCSTNEYVFHNRTEGTIFDDKHELYYNSFAGFGDTPERSEYNIMVYPNSKQDNPMEVNTIIRHPTNGSGLNVVISVKLTADEIIEELIRAEIIPQYSNWEWGWWLYVKKAEVYFEGNQTLESALLCNGAIKNRGPYTIRVVPIPHL